MRIPVVVLAIALLAPSLASAQERGVSGDNPGQPAGVRRAVVIGVSKYPTLPPNKQLEYAAADARAFQDYLKSPAGGSVPAENLQLLIDENATAGNIMNALAWLRLNSQEGDEAIIYFAGHGDTEMVTGGGVGFLLASDVNPALYVGGGAISIDLLKAFLGGIVSKGTTPLLITDLSRSGKTTAALLEAWNNVTKIVSSAADESPYEGKQWGGGHGAFTYFLILGLQGLADNNVDGVVTLEELARFVDEHVGKETGGHQNPQTSGNYRRILARVDPATKRAAQIAMAGRQPSLTPTR